jgi:hypothetical protein
VGSEPRRDISEILSDPTVVTRAGNEAVQEAIRRHKQMGLPMAVWQDGAVVWIAAEDLERARGGEGGAGGG